MGNSILNPWRRKKGDAALEADPLSEESLGRRSRASQRGGSTTSGRKAPDLREAGGPAFTLDEAIELQGELRMAFGEPSFQKLVKHTREQHPNHEQKSHRDHEAYTSDLQKLMLSVYNKVLPKEPWCLSPGWIGARQMRARMAPVLDHPRITSLQNQIDALLLGDASAVDDELIIDTPHGCGVSPEYELQLVTDSQGDLAHEFWAMDRGTLRCRKGGARTVVTPIIRQITTPARKVEPPEEPCEKKDKKDKKETKEEKKSKKGKKKAKGAS